MNHRLREKTWRATEKFLTKMEAEDIQADYIRRFVQWVQLNPDIPIERMFWPAGVTRN